MTLSLLLSNGKHCNTKTTSQEDAPGMNVPWTNLCRFLYPLVHDLSKYVRSHLDLDPHHFKVQEIVGTWDFAFDIYGKDTLNIFSWVLNRAYSWPMSRLYLVIGYHNGTTLK